MARVADPVARSGLAADLAPWAGVIAALREVPDPVVVACSGGPDSLALLALACAAGRRCVAVHVDHGLRPDSAHDFGIVATAAETFGAIAQSCRVDVPPGPNLEARAREARYAVLEAARARLGASAVLVGHTADDQAETVLLNVLRGSGLDGLAGMPATRDAVRRPLLGVRRADTREICARLGLAPVDDPMNADLRHRRVWLRREVLPLLEQGAARDLGALLARQAAVVRADVELLDGLASRAAVGLGAAPDTGGLLALEPALARRVVRHWLGPPPPPLADVEGVLAVARGERSAVEVGGGRRVERSGGRIHLVGAAATAPAGCASYDVAVPGVTTAGDLVLEARVERGAPTAWPDGRSGCVLDADRAGAAVVLRPARPGERFHPLGLGASKTVFDVLSDHGVAASARGRAPVLVAGPDAAVPPGDVLWVVGYRIDHRVRVTSRTRRYLWIDTGARPT